MSFMDAFLLRNMDLNAVHSGSGDRCGRYEMDTWDEEIGLE